MAYCWVRNISDLGTLRILCFCILFFYYYCFLVNYQKQFWFFVLLHQITACSSMLSFKGSPYWMAPEVYYLCLSRSQHNPLSSSHSPAHYPHCLFAFWTFCFSYECSLMCMLLMFLSCFLISGCNEYKWLQSCCWYLEFGMYNSWNGNVQTTMEPVWGGAILDIHKLFLYTTHFVMAIFEVFVGPKLICYVGLNRWLPYSKSVTAKILLKFLKGFQMMQRVL